MERDSDPIIWEQFARYFEISIFVL
jgi:hypothetical protein